MVLDDVLVTRPYEMLLWYGTDSTGSTAEDSSSVFSLVQMY